MDLTQAPDAYLAELDRQLKLMEQEKAEMEEKYGFSEKFSSKMTLEQLDKKKSDLSRVTDYQIKDKRYAVTKFDEKAFEIDKSMFKRMRPEISADWVVVNKIEPNIKQFYDKKEFESQMFDKADYQLSKDLQPKQDQYDAYMQSYSQFQQISQRMDKELSTMQQFSSASFLTEVTQLHSFLNTSSNDEFDAKLQVLKQKMR